MISKRLYTALPLLALHIVLIAAVKKELLWQPDVDGKN